MADPHQKGSVVQGRQRVTECANNGGSEATLVPVLVGSRAVALSLSYHVSYSACTEIIVVHFCILIFTQHLLNMVGIGVETSWT